jgi:hypothetical protein
MIPPESWHDWVVVVVMATAAGVLALLWSPRAEA